MILHTPDWPHVYETSLTSFYYGFPLWNPQPSSSANRVNIGDVGYVYNGEFYRIFNVLKKDDKYCGNAKPLSFSPENDLRENTLGPIPIVSDDVKWRVTRNETLGSKTYEFEVKDSSRGAIMIPLSGMKEQSLNPAKEQEWKRYMARNLDNWPESTVCSRRDLLLVHTRIMATEWIIMPFEMKDRPVKKWRFKLEVPDKPGAGKLRPEALDGCAFSHTPEPRQGVDIISMANGNIDPAHCIFLRGYQPTRSRGVLGWKVEDTLPRAKLSEPVTELPPLPLSETASGEAPAPMNDINTSRTSNPAPLPSTNPPVRRKTLAEAVRRLILRNRVIAGFQDVLHGTRRNQGDDVPPV